MTSQHWLSRQHKIKITVITGFSAMFCNVLLYFTYLALASELQPNSPRKIVDYWGSMDWATPKSPTARQWSLCPQENMEVSQHQLEETTCNNTEALLANTENTEPIHQPVFTPDMGSNYSNLFELPCPPYLKNYHNPCWKEYIDSIYPYEGNPYWKEKEEYFTMAQGNLSIRRDRGQNWRMRCLPHFFLVGPPKTGTTDFFIKLLKHPEVMVAGKKEPNWWTISRFSEDGVVSLTQYLDLFDVAAQRLIKWAVPEPGCKSMYHPRIMGDYSTWTFTAAVDWHRLPENKFSENGPRYTTPHYIRHLIPKSKIIFILRNPVDRLYSAYYFYDVGTKTPQAFHEWCVTNIEIFKACLHQQELRACTYKMNRSQLTVGIYLIFIQDWLSVFPREQVHFIHLEKQYSTNPIETLEGVLEFLGISPIPQQTLSNLNLDLRRNTGQYQAMLAETRELLSEFYRPFNEQLAKLLADDRYMWAQTAR